jgi:hypothetical protein
MPPRRHRACSQPTGPAASRHAETEHSVASQQVLSCRCPCTTSCPAPPPSPPPRRETCASVARTARAGGLVMWQMPRETELKKNLKNAHEVNHELARAAWRDAARRRAGEGWRGVAAEPPGLLRQRPRAATVRGAQEAAGRGGRGGGRTGRQSPQQQGGEARAAARGQRRRRRRGCMPSSRLLPKLGL